MAFEQKNNTGSLFKNDKANSASHPQAKGDALIDGVPYWVSAWTNVDKKGNRYQSLKFERKEEQRPRSRQPDDGDQYERFRRDDDSSIPF